MPDTSDRAASAAMWTFVVAASLLGLIYLAVIPPFSGPDESSHFDRAWWVSEGHLLALRDGANVGYVLPYDLILLYERFRPKPTVNPADVAAALHAPPAGARDVFVHDPGHAVASVLLYVPQGIGIALGRALRVSPVLCAYAGRLLNLAAGTVLIALAIRFMPAQRWLMFALALTPMSTYLRSSLSGDVLTIALAFLFTALVARFLFLDDEPLTARRWTAITLLGGAICLTKVTYIPLAALPLIAPQKRFGSAAAAWRARAIYTAIAVAAAAISSRIASYYWAPFNSLAPHPSEQMRFIAAHPLSFAKALFDEYVIRAKWYLISMVGDIGNGGSIVVLPKLLVAFYFACLLLLAVADTERRPHVRALQRVVLAGVCVASAVAVAFAIYTTWNPVGWGRIDGLQGRYYLPLVPAGAFIAHRASAGIGERWRMAVAVAAVAIGNAVALDVVVRQWYPAGWHSLLP